MTQELQDRWLAALRSGRYKQGSYRLHRFEGEESQYCCLGVLCDVIDPDGWDFPSDDIGQVWRGQETSVPPYYLHEQVQATLIGMNDSAGASFMDIANHIEGMGIAFSNDGSKEAQP